MEVTVATVAAICDGVQVAPRLDGDDGYLYGGEEGEEEGEDDDARRDHHRDDTLS